MGGVLRLRTRGGGRDFEPDELAGVAGTKKIATALTVTIVEQAPTHTLTAYRPQGDNAPYNSCQPSSKPRRVGGLSGHKDIKKSISELENLLKKWNISDAKTFAFVVSNNIGAEPSIDRVTRAQNAEEISYYLNLPQYSLRIGLHNLNAENYKGVRKRPKNYGITFKDATDADTFRPYKDVDVKEYVYVYTTKDRLKKIAEAILHLLENGEWDNDIAPADYVNPQQSKDPKGLGGVNDYYVLYDDDWNEIADLGRGKNLRTVKKEAKQILESKNISEATLEIQDAWTGEIKDSITIDRYNARQKPENRVLYDYEREGGRDFEPEKEKSQKKEEFLGTKKADNNVIDLLISFKKKDVRRSPNLVQNEHEHLICAFDSRLRPVSTPARRSNHLSGANNENSVEIKKLLDKKIKQWQKAKTLSLEDFMLFIALELRLRASKKNGNHFSYYISLFDSGDRYTLRISDHHYDASTSEYHNAKKTTALTFSSEITENWDYFKPDKTVHAIEYVYYEDKIGKDELIAIAKDVVSFVENGKYTPSVEPNEVHHSPGLEGVKRTATQTANHSALLRKHNIDLKRFEPFVSTDDLYPALQGVYFLRYRNRA